MIDRALGKVISHEPPPRSAAHPSLEQAGQLLEKEKARREAAFRESAEQEKVKSQILDRKFADALKKTKDQPVTRPLRDLDLD